MQNLPHGILARIQACLTVSIACNTSGTSVCPAKPSWQINRMDTIPQLRSLPPIVHIRKEADKAAIRWSLERMKEELRDPQPGGSLIAQQLAYMMLVQALRLHLADASSAGRGWLSALSDKHMSIAIARMHSDPGYAWTLKSLAERVAMSRSVFALRFREIVGS